MNGMRMVYKWEEIKKNVEVTSNNHETDSSETQEKKGS